MRVSQHLILLPLFVQVALTLGVLFALWWTRTRFLLKNRISPQKAALSADLWPEQAQKLANNFKNLFEIPVLFFMAALFAHSARQVDDTFLVLAVMFVLSRIAHTVIHVGPNWVAPRFYVSLAGAVIVAVMWVLLFWRVAAAGF